MGEYFKRNGAPWWRDPRNGRECRLEALLKSTRRDAMSYEMRQENTNKELYRQLATRSVDVPGSPESRLVRVDNRQQRIIRSCGVLMPVMADEPLVDYQFYNARMSQAIKYLARKHGFKYGSDAYKELAAFLWVIYQNRYSKAVDQMCKALGIPKSTYYDRIDTYRADFDEPEWRRITELTDKLLARFKSVAAIEERLFSPEKA